MVQLRYDWSRLGSAKWFQFQLQKIRLLTEDLWLRVVALLRMSLVLLGQVGLERQVVLFVAKAGIQKSKLHLTSIFEFVIVSQWLMKLWSNFVTYPSRASQWRIRLWPLDMEQGR